MRRDDARSKFKIATRKEWWGLVTLMRQVCGGSCAVRMEEFETEGGGADEEGEVVLRDGDGRKRLLCDDKPSASGDVVR